MTTKKWKELSKGIYDISVKKEGGLEGDLMGKVLFTNGLFITYYQLQIRDKVQQKTRCRLDEPSKGFRGNYARSRYYFSFLDGMNL